MWKGAIAIFVIGCFKISQEPCYNNPSFNLNLVSGEIIFHYRQENEALIRRNQIRINQERNYVKEQIAREASEQQKRAQLFSQIDKEAQAVRKREHEDLLNDLSNKSNISTAEVLARHKKILQDEKSKTKFENKLLLSNFNTSQTESYESSLQNKPQEPCFVYEPFTMDLSGPEMPSKNSIFENGYLIHVRDSALKDVGGGYNSVIACERALNDAFGGLFFKPACKAIDLA